MFNKIRYLNDKKFEKFKLKFYGLKLKIFKGLFDVLICFLKCFMYVCKLYLLQFFGGKKKYPKKHAKYFFFAIIWTKFFR